MLDYAFNTLGLNKVVATIRPENKASCKVAERLGMTIESEFVKVHDDKVMPHFVYSIQRANFNENGRAR
nr:GNAT family protein [Fictibacillus macauensis]